MTSESRDRFLRSPGGCNLVMDRWRGRVALVTGASVGIGASVVEKLVEHGMTVVGCARNVAKIEVQYRLVALHNT